MKGIPFHFEIKGTIALRFGSYNIGYAMWENFVLVSTRLTSVAMIHPVVNLSLDPRNRNPSEDKPIHSIDLKK
jgi:hypothetical protein